MLNYIKKNNSVGLFFVHLLLPFVELIAKLSLIGLALSSMLGKDFSVMMAMAFGVAHMAIISRVYEKSINATSVNYLLSLGQTRQSIFKDIMLLYAGEILIYCLGLLLFFTVAKVEYMIPYIAMRLITSIITAPIFLSNMIQKKPHYYAILSVYYFLSLQGIFFLLVVSLPITIYLMIDFRKLMMEQNLI